MVYSIHYYFFFLRFSCKNDTKLFFMIKSWVYCLISQNKSITYTYIAASSCIVILMSELYIVQHLVKKNISNEIKKINLHYPFVRPSLLSLVTLSFILMYKGVKYMGDSFSTKVCLKKRHYVTDTKYRNCY